VISYSQLKRKSVISGGYFDELDDFGLTITRRCELLGIGRWSAYNKPTLPNNEKLMKDELYKNKLDFWHTIMPYAGVRKLKKLLKEHEKIYIGNKRIRRLMNEMGIYVIYPKLNLSKPGKNHKKFPYLLRNKSISFPNQVWAIDITYIPMGTVHMYLTAIIDWHSRLIVGWELSDMLKVEPVIQAVNNAMLAMAHQVL